MPEPARLKPWLWALLLAPLFATAGPVSEYTLDNGLRILVKEDHRAPVVVSQVWYKVGASYEHRGITGVSHVLEHMMFQGTEKHPPGEFSRIIAENGGEENAFTGRDYTAYFQQLEKSRLPISFELEADRMQNLKLQAERFDKERKVVMEERRLRTEDDPQSLTYETFAATAYLNGPYHHPVIGWMDDLRDLTLADLRDWYRRFYAPNNATLVVAGDVDPDEVHRLAQEHFGPIPAGPEPAVKPREERPQQGERRVTVQAPAKLPYLIMGYKTPVLRSLEEAPWKAYALEVLAGVLDGGSSARLARELVRGRQIATSASAGYDFASRHDGLLTLSGVPTREHSVAELEEALRGQVRRLQEEPVAAEELERVKAQVAASDVYERDSVFYQAMQIGMLETVGLDWRIGPEYVEKVRAVTAEQVRQVARQYLSPERLTVAVLEPQSAGDGSEPTPRAGQAGVDDVRH